MKICQSDSDFCFIFLSRILQRSLHESISDLQNQVNDFRSDIIWENFKNSMTLCRNSTD